MVSAVRIAINNLAGVPSIEFVKIHVQGFELQVLQGAQHLLATHRPVLVFEHEPVGPTARQTSDLFTLLDDAGYDIERLVDWRAPRSLSRAEFEASYDTGDSYFIGRPRHT